MKRQEIYLVLHNIRSAYNVGSIFRTADAAGVKKIYICGYSPTPNDKKVTKTSLGAEKFVPWEYHRQTWRLMEKLKQKGVQVVALEQAKKSVDYQRFRPRFPLALVVGNEVRGLNEKMLARAGRIINVPMFGKKESLNVAVAAGIVVYELIKNKKPRRART